MRHRVSIAVVLAASVCALHAIPARAVDSQLDGAPSASFWRYAPGQHVAEPRLTALRRAADIQQRIGSARVRAAGNGRVRLRFAIAYPRVGRGTGTGWARVRVYSSPRRATVLATIGRPVRTARGRRGRTSLLIDGAAGRALSAALRTGRRRALRMITIESFHGRELDGDHGIDQTVGLTRIAARVTDRPRATPRRARARAAQLGGTSMSLEVVNQAQEWVLLSAAPVTCMYSNGESGSELTSFNGAKLAPGSSLVYNVEDDSNTGHSVQRYFSWDAPASQPQGSSIVVSPAWVDQNVYSSEIAGFLFNANSYYEQSEIGLDPYIPNTFLEAYNALPSLYDLDCATTTSLFAIGADAYVNGNSGPTSGHAASVFELESSDEVSQQASLDHELVEQLANFGGATGLATNVNSNEQIEIADQTSGDCTKGGQSWMRCVFAPGSQAEQTPLSNVVFPGSHDSGTPNLASSSDWMLDQPTPPVPEDLCSHSSFFLEEAANAVYDAASTQPFVIRQQLDLGIRYLDLRVAYDPGYGDDPGDTWRVIHTMMGQDTVQTVAQTVANWVAANPDEIVVLDFNHVCPGTNGDTSGLMSALSAGGPSGESLCDVAYVTPGDPQDLPQTTLAGVRSSGKNAIVLLDGNYSYDIPSGCGFYPFYDQTTNNPSGSAGNVQVNHLWPNVSGPGADACVDSSSNASYATTIAAYPLDSSNPGFGTAPSLQSYRSADPVPFTQTQTQYTPDSADEIEALLQCANLAGYEALQIADYRPGILSQWGSLANFVIGDMVSYDYVNQLIGFNSPAARAPKPVEPPSQAPFAGRVTVPSASLRSLRRGRVTVSARCLSACRIDAGLTVATGAPDSARLGSLRLVAGASERRLSRPGVARLRLRPSRGAMAYLRAHRSVRVRAVVTITDAATQRVERTVRTVRLRATAS
jgi:hypothetical protein